MKPENFETCKKLMEQIAEAERDLESAKELLHHEIGTHVHISTFDGSFQQTVSREFLHVACDRLTQRLICYKADLETL